MNLQIFREVTSKRSAKGRRGCSSAVMMTCSESGEKITSTMADVELGSMFISDSTSKT